MFLEWDRPLTPRLNVIEYQVYDGFEHCSRWFARDAYERMLRGKKKTPQHASGILTSDLKDPWNHDYIYVYPGTHGAFDLISYGADGQQGGTGSNEDVVSWDIEFAQ